MKGLPHNHAVSAIISLVGASDNERELVPFQNKTSGHSGACVQYTESVVNRISKWLKDNNYPQTIQGVDKTYKVNYLRISA